VERQNGWHRGAARLALVTGAPLVPVRLSGTQPLPWRTRVRIEVGEPFRVPVARPTVAAAKSLTDRLEQAVTTSPA
jgi:1-acyl-sn-glycerol-3-phosphate acyltransferase